MKNEIIQKLGAVINALNNVCVKGEQNLANLSGSITILKEVAEQVNNLKEYDETKNKEISTKSKR